MTRKTFLQRVLLTVPALSLIGFKLPKEFGTQEDVVQEQSKEPQTEIPIVFKDVDLFAYINGISIGMLESIAYTVEYDYIDLLQTGTRDGKYRSPLETKRRIFGTMNFSQYDSHPVLKTVVDIVVPKSDKAKITYCDQIPPFDLTIIGKEKTGKCVKCILFGVQISREKGVFTDNIEISFIARDVKAWSPCTVNDTPEICYEYLRKVL